MDLCDLLDPLFEDEDKFDKVLKDYMYGFEDLIKPCIFGDGNL